MPEQSYNLASPEVLKFFNLSERDVNPKYRREQIGKLVERFSTDENLAYKNALTNQGINPQSFWTRCRFDLKSRWETFLWCRPIQFWKVCWIAPPFSDKFMMGDREKSQAPRIWTHYPLIPKDVPCRCATSTALLIIIGLMADIELKHESSFFWYCLHRDIFNMRGLVAHSVERPSKLPCQCDSTDWCGFEPRPWQKVVGKKCRHKIMTLAAPS